jgi:DNA invertase Pin-like site-specific DNA recombinase
MSALNVEGHIMKRVAIYSRVSTGSQTTENQERELREVAARAGWDVVKVYTDAGISGAKGRDQRPGFDAICKDAARRKFDVIAAWSVDRLGRSLHDLTGFLNDMHGLKIDLYLHQQGVDTTTAGGKALFHMVGVFAEFERAIIRERVMAGMKRARKDGTKSGKAFGRPKTDAKVEAHIAKTLATGLGVISTARKHGVGVGTVQRIKRAARAA